MYPILLAVHSWLRWAALLGVAFALLRAVRGFIARSPWTRADTTWLKGAAHAMTAQFVVGIVLYSVSPFIRGLMGDMATTMRDRASRFFVVEHAAIMFLALAAVHVAVLLTRSASDDRSRHLRVLVCTLITLALVGYGIPWDRPLVR